MRENCAGRSVSGPRRVKPNRTVTASRAVYCLVSAAFPEKWVDMIPIAAISVVRR
jgi:hypothetical protein